MTTNDNPRAPDSPDGPNAAPAPATSVTTAPIEPLLLRREDAAKLLAISPRLLWSLTRRGEIPHVRLAKSVRYSVEALRAWLRRRATGGK